MFWHKGLQLDTRCKAETRTAVWRLAAMLTAQWFTKMFRSPLLHSNPAHKWPGCVAGLESGSRNNQRLTRSQEMLSRQALVPLQNARKPSQQKLWWHRRRSEHQPGRELKRLNYSKNHHESYSASLCRINKQLGFQRIQILLAKVKKTNSFLALFSLAWSLLLQTPTILLTEFSSPPSVMSPLINSSKWPQWLELISSWCVQPLQKAWEFCWLLSVNLAQTKTY